MGATVIGKLNWTAEGNDKGHRTYTTDVHIITDSPLDGPQVAANAVGLPVIGSIWNVDNDYDAWAWCRPRYEISPLNSDSEPDVHWVMTNYWSSDPIDRCNDNDVENPLAEPPEISGSFIKYKEEAVKDKDGELLLMSSRERMKGPVVEMERGRPVVNISMNIADLSLSSISSLRGKVNSDTMWGLPARCVLLADITWTRNIYGSCGFYYTVNYTFEVKYETYDRYIVDEGTQVLWHSEADPNILANYRPYRDGFDQPGSCLLDGVGSAAETQEDVYVWRKEIEEETNFFSLGIPSTL